MCGICGFNWEDKELLREMTNTLQHRGPDGEGHYSDKNISLGHRRLSIIDLSNDGKQPMCNEDGSVWLTFNGEIYNFQELRTILEQKGHQFKSNTDSEVIIHSYEEWGEECLNKFNGMFAFAIYDQNKKRLFLARDRLGIKPLYYYWNNNEFIFASEIKSILAHNKLKKEINREGLRDIFCYSYISGEKTIFKKIYKLLPGKYAVLKNGELTINSFWDLNENVISKNNHHPVKELQRLLEKSVKYRLISDVPIGTYLSGGLDSSTITALAAKFKENIQTFSVGFGEGMPNELNYARKVAEHIGTNHREFIVTAKDIEHYPKIVQILDEPIGELALLPTFLLSKHVKKYATVVLAGEGADELFGGYMRHQMFLFKNKIGQFIPKPLMSIPYQLSKKFSHSNFNKILAILNSKDNLSTYQEIISISNSSEVSNIVKLDTNNSPSNTYLKKLFTEFNSKDDFNKFLYTDIKTLLPDNYFMKADRMTMAHGIEERVPFLDHNLVEFSMSIPVSMKRNLFQNKIILRNAAKNLLPKEILQRPKRGYDVPIDHWFKKELKEKMEHILDNPSADKKALVNYAYFQKIFKHFKRTGNNYQANFYNMSKLWNLFTFDMWYDLYFRE